MAESEVGLRLSLKDRKQTSAGLRAVGDDIDRLGHSATTSSRKTGNLMGALGMVGKGIGYGAAALGALGTATATWAFKSAVSIQTATQNLATLTGSAKTAKMMVKQLTDYGNATTFDTAPLAQSAQQMLAFGIAQKDVLPDMKMLGDIAMGNQEKLSGLAYVFAQVQGVGHLMGGDLNQMINNGFNPLLYISRRTGKSMGDLRQEMSKGNISIGMVKQAMVDATKKGGTFYHGAINGSKTVAGAWGNLVGTLQSGLGNALQPVLPLVTKLLGKLSNLASGAVPHIAAGVKSVVGLFQGLGKGSAGGALDKISGSASNAAKAFAGVKRFVGAMVPVFVDFGTKLKSTLGPGIKQIAGVFNTQFLPAFTKILPVLQPVAKFLLKMFGDAVIGVIKGAIKVIVGVVQVISGVFNLIADLVHGNWGKLWGDFKQILGGAIKAVLGAIQVWWNFGILSFFKKGITYLTKDLWTGLWKKVSTGATKGMGFVKGEIGKGISAVKGLFIRGVKAYFGIWKSLFTTIIHIAVNGWKVLRSAFGGAWAAIRTVTSTTLHAIGGFFSHTFGAIKGFVSGAVSTIIKLLASIPGRLAALPGQLLSLGKNMGSRILKGLFAGLKAVGGFVGNLGGAIKGAINSALHLPFTIHGPGPLPDFTIPAFAKGGIVTKPTLGLFGEAGPEAVVPLKHYDQQRTADIAATTRALTHGNVPRAAHPALGDYRLDDIDEMRVGPGHGGHITVQFVVDRKVLTEAVLDGVDDRVARR
ncbi:hypothetical protein GCM10028801_41280 [Nocardioides maradonensis]